MVKYGDNVGELHDDIGDDIGNGADEVCNNGHDISTLYDDRSIDYDNYIDGNSDNVNGLLWWVMIITVGHVSGLNNNAPVAFKKQQASIKGLYGLKNGK